MRISEQLQQRLSQDLGLEVDIPVRIRRGRHGIVGGTWAWFATYTSGTGEIGSEDTMTECVNAKSISTYRELNFPYTVRVVADSDPVTQPRGS